MAANALCTLWALFWGSALYSKRGNLDLGEVIGVVSIVAAPIVCVLVERNFP